MEPNVHDESKGCLEEIKANGLLLRPVAAGESGVGLPYAPTNWPNPGDNWGWRVGNRKSGTGFWLDRYLYPPSHLQCKRQRLASKNSVQQFIQKEFPNGDIDTFFASFSWKIPSEDNPWAKGEVAQFAPVFLEKEPKDNEPLTKRRRLIKKDDTPNLPRQTRHTILCTKTPGAIYDLTEKEDSVDQTEDTSVVLPSSLEGTEETSVLKEVSPEVAQSPHSLGHSVTDPPPNSIEICLYSIPSISTDNLIPEVSSPIVGVRDMAIVDSPDDLDAMMQDLLGDDPIPSIEDLQPKKSSEPIDPISSHKELSKMLHQIKEQIESFISLGFNEIIHPDRRHIVEDTIKLLSQVSSGELDPCHIFATSLASALAASGDYECIIGGINDLEALVVKESSVKAKTKEIQFTYLTLQVEQKSTKKKITEAEECVKEIDIEILKLEVKKTEMLKVIETGKVKEGEQLKKRKTLMKEARITITKKKRLEKELNGAREKKKGVNFSPQ